MSNIEFNKNEDSMRLLNDQLKHRLSKIFEGGGPKNAAKQKEQGKLLARERIEYLIDKGSNFIEIGAFAADGMYEEYGGCPAAGVVAGIGYVSKCQCVIVANDATVKAGAWFPMSGKKNSWLASKIASKLSRYLQIKNMLFGVCLFIIVEAASKNSRMNLKSSIQSRYCT